ncbi:hypothetical protein ALI144C_25335 [Actinosynnema sp. ALI-1.44]|uniref:hypothetical protein n=1 Tax=Actinosynnema sp. ALI-1.44 TaxID=1933779 RepID=UPI00097C3531|nr:hypothetical protein [Actinosynnema sp. ALI-1.44]ONI79165.1 hypothetical protein ALI144C_25335 [Actinosynnema sp. ALI-1.44]
MSWNDYYERRDAIDSVLVRAGKNPGGPLPQSPAFTDPAQLLLAMHYRWTMKLTGRLGTALSEAENDPSADMVDAISDAWRQVVADNPTLYAVLEAHADRYEELRPQRQAEKRTLALAAGLAEAHEPTEEITRVGAAFRTLLQTAAEQPARKCGVVEQLLRRLVASA